MYQPPIRIDIGKLCILIYERGFSVFYGHYSEYTDWGEVVLVLIIPAIFLMAALSGSEFLQDCPVRRLPTAILASSWTLVLTVFSFSSNAVPFGIQCMIAGAAVVVMWLSAGSMLLARYLIRKLRRRLKLQTSSSAENTRGSSLHGQ